MQSDMLLTRDAQETFNRAVTEIVTQLPRVTARAHRRRCDRFPLWIGTVRDQLRRNAEPVTAHGVRIHRDKSTHADVRLLDAVNRAPQGTFVLPVGPRCQLIVLDNAVSSTLAFGADEPVHVPDFDNNTVNVDLSQERLALMAAMSARFHYNYLGHIVKLLSLILPIEPEVKEITNAWGHSVPVGAFFRPGTLCHVVLDPYTLCTEAVPCPRHHPETHRRRVFDGPPVPFRPHFKPKKPVISMDPYWIDAPPRSLSLADRIITFLIGIPRTALRPDQGYCGGGFMDNGPLLLMRASGHAFVTAGRFRVNWKERAEGLFAGDLHVTGYDARILRDRARRGMPTIYKASIYTHENHHAGLVVIAPNGDVSLYEPGHNNANFKEPFARTVHFDRPFGLQAVLEATAEEYRTTCAVVTTLVACLMQHLDYWYPNLVDDALVRIYEVSDPGKRLVHNAINFLIQEIEYWQGKTEDSFSRYTSTFYVDDVYTVHLPWMHAARQVGLEEDTRLNPERGDLQLVPLNI